VSWSAVDLNVDLRVLFTLVIQLETLLERSQDDPRINCNDYGIPFFRWFINPHDFGQSVENLFYTSFLVREGKCAIEFDEADGEMRISE
jgi:hypothetical protein